MSELTRMIPAISVRHLWHRFGNQDVLQDVSFDVMPGEIFGFIGPNGAGKTTTIRIISTLIEPVAGRVLVDGLDVALEPTSVRKLIGYMPDHAGVYDRVTVREYLEFFTDAYDVPNLAGDYAVVDAVMELTDLTKLSQKLVATMSKGMKQRLQLARTLLHDPKVLILDEPASDLDPRARIEMRDLLLELRDMGKTVFLSSHILTELADVCSSVAILEKGKVVVSGPIDEIARRLEEDAPMTDRVPSSRGVASARGAAYVAKRGAKLRALAPFELIDQVLRGHGALQSLTQVPSAASARGEVSVLITYLGDDQTLSEIVRRLVMSNVLVVGVEPERSELERIFLEVTKGDSQ